MHWYDGAKSGNGLGKRALHSTMQKQPFGVTHTGNTSQTVNFTIVISFAGT